MKSYMSTASYRLRAICISGTISLQVPGVLSHVFAVLAGCPSDPTLKTIPKNGAYHTKNVKTKALLDIASETQIRKDIGGTDVCPSDESVLKYKPSGSLLSIHCWSEHC
jgi:hypothetical protein